MTAKNNFGFVRKMGISLAVLFLAAACGRASFNYGTQQACEKATGKSCILELCDIPPCPSHSNKGWQPVEAESSQKVPTPSPEPDKTSNWNSYTSPAKFGFSIKYPADFGFNTDLRKIIPQSYIPICDEGVKTVAGCIYYSGRDYEGTNFDSAGVEIAIIKGLKTPAECYLIGTAEPKKVLINGVEFAYAEQNEGAAGHFSSDRIYRSLKGSDCYQLRARVAFTNLDNYEPGTIKKFSGDEVWQKLQDITETFKFVDGRTKGR